jgi:hypothetical protein
VINQFKELANKPHWYLPMKIHSEVMFNNEWNEIDCDCPDLSSLLSFDVSPTGIDLQCNDTDARQFKERGRKSIIYDLPTFFECILPPLSKSNETDYHLALIV